MATVAGNLENSGVGGGQSGSPIARAVDRWIYVGMAAWFILIVLGGFIPDSIFKIEALRSGLRPPFPAILHVHALTMGALLLLLFAQALFMATGQRERHYSFGRAMFVLAPAIFIVWLILVPTVYHLYWAAAQTAPIAARPKLHAFALALNDIFLGQLRIGSLFPLYIFIGLRARRSDPELHKRMMILALATTLAPALARMWWLPKPFASELMSRDFYTVLAISPMFLWDVIRTRTVPKAYLIWLLFYALVSIPVYALAGTPWWHSTVEHLMGVSPAT